MVLGDIIIIIKRKWVIVYCASGGRFSYLTIRHCSDRPGLYKVVIKENCDGILTK